MRDTPTVYGIRPGFMAASLHAGGCLWIEGEDFVERIRAHEDPHCGAIRAPGSSYCAKHSRLANAPSKGPVWAPRGA